jgi:multidrug efflux pump subunit AcrB
VEQIHRTHEEHPETPTRELLAKSISFLLPSMVGSSVSTIVIFLPFALLSGVAGAYFNILTNTMMITLICSYLVTWIGLPVIYLLLSGKRKRVKPAHLAVSSGKGRRISFFIHRPAISLLFVALLILIIARVPGKLETGFLPEMSSRD